MSFSTVPSIPEIPLELMHLIFSFLPRASRKRFAGLSRSLHWALQPKLFEHTTIRLDEHVNDEDFSWMLNKVLFITNSKRVSHAVTFLRVIGPLSVSHFELHCGQFMELFFNVLRNLVNLQVIQFSRIILQPHQLERLKESISYGRVDEIIVDYGCWFQIDKNSSKRIALSLKFLRCYSGNNAQVIQPGAYWWWKPPRPQPMPLTSLVLANVDAAHVYVRAMMSELTPMEGLKSLSVPVELAVSPSLRAVLCGESCTGLEALRFTYASRFQWSFNSSIDIFSLPPFALPFLKLYDGPPEMVALFCSERLVRHLVLSALTDGRIALLVKFFSQMQNADRILSLHIDIDSINESVIQFLSIFRNLQALSINVESNVFFGYQPFDAASNILSQSPHKLSAHLRFFSLSVYTCRKKDSPSPLTTSIYEMRRPSYLEHCVNLQYAGFSEGENNAFMQFNPCYGIRIQEKKTIEMWQNAALGLYEPTVYDPVPSTKSFF